MQFNRQRSICIPPSDTTFAAIHALLHRAREGASTHCTPAPRALARCQGSDYCTTFSGNNAVVMIAL